MESPPNAGFHAILHADDSFTHVVQFVSCSHVAVGLHLLEEIGIVVKRACQLVRVAFVNVVETMVVPLQGIITIERIAGTYADIVKIGVCLNQAANLFHAVLGALSPFAIVRLVEWRDTHHVHAALLGISYTGFDELVPSLRLVQIEGLVFLVVAVLLVQGIFLVVVDGHFVAASHQDVITTTSQCRFCLSVSS